ncbi:hypothetical protein K450DRAFT_227814 [Umbelopsis ramanniana AG]|uniref:Uncharacterized protein n=1 Tax=Umbelopsis ramanniana AG TaxID=1314678 RepID=A0AAD5EFL6_UMBRA|nr:uncharacterized protein K450DRAFT_227814 [Umbelopsis ramanniana AG]KAI8582579.1 hypothetical protein K450DRAFT_227814 [Umbelopsis ramanniana AG]
MLACAYIDSSVFVSTHSRMLAYRRILSLANLYHITFCFLSPFLDTLSKQLYKGKTTRNE